MTEHFQESFQSTILRTGSIAIVVGALLALARGGVGRWPVDTAIVLWVSFGGHWIEVWFLNWLRPRLSGSRSVRTAARIAVWFVAGIGLAAGMSLTARLRHWPAWWIGGLAFIGVELVVHLALQLRGRPSFYNGRG